MHPSVPRLFLFSYGVEFPPGMTFLTCVGSDQLAAHWKWRHSGHMKVLRRLWGHVPAVDPQQLSVCRADSFCS